jgi:hypothetical protein
MLLVWSRQHHDPHAFDSLTIVHASFRACSGPRQNLECHERAVASCGANTQVGTFMPALFTSILAQGTVRRKGDRPDKARGGKDTALNAASSCLDPALNTCPSTTTTSDSNGTTEGTPGRR